MELLNLRTLQDASKCWQLLINKNYVFDTLIVNGRYTYDGNFTYYNYRRRFPLKQRYGNT